MENATEAMTNFTKAMTNFTSNVTTSLTNAFVANDTNTSEVKSNGFDWSLLVPVVLILFCVIIACRSGSDNDDQEEDRKGTKSQRKYDRKYLEEAMQAMKH